MINTETKEKALKWAAANKVVVPAIGNGATLNEAALRIAVKLIKQSEGLSLRSYPDPCSPLSIELSKHGILQKFIDGKLELPPYLAKLSGEPYTAMYGETKCVKQGQVYTIEEANSRLEARVMEFMQGVVKASPRLLKASAEKLAAITSLAYNIGLSAYADSTACKRIAVEDWVGAAEAITWFNKAGGKVIQGLVNRRKIEKDLFLSVRS